jgi:putative oxidoreductase
VHKCAMEPILGKWSEPLYAILRIDVGFLYACHGAQKLFGVLGWHGPGHAHGLMLAAGVIEFGCGLLIVLGLFVSPAAFLAAGEMAVAYFMMHYPQGFWPINNKGELAVAYCFLFLYFASRGGGALSLDRVTQRK